MISYKIKKILIVLDYDPAALKVSDVGFKLAKDKEAEVILLHVIINLITYSLTYLKMQPLKFESIEDLKKISHNFTLKSKRHLGENMIQSIVKEGEFATSIFNSAEEMAVDVIVMGSQSTKWLEEMVMGKITHEALQQINIPLIIVPNGKQDKMNTLISLVD